MNSIHLFNKPIWLEIDSDILKLSSKSILIIYPQDEEQTAEILISPADPQGIHSGKYSVKVWDAIIGSISPKTGSWFRFLDDHALKSIKSGSSYYGNASCILKLSE